MTLYNHPFPLQMFEHQLKHYAQRLIIAKDRKASELEISYLEEELKDLKKSFPVFFN